MYCAREFKNLDKLDYENKEKKRTVEKEYFLYLVAKESNGIKYLYNDTVIGAIDMISCKYKIICNESFQSIFNYISDNLYKIGY